jgi:DNA polymerase-3 subunit delta
MAADRPLPAYLVTGDDPALRADAVRALVRDLVGDADPTLVVEDLDGDDVEPGTVADAARTPPFLADRRVVIVREVGRFTTEALAPLLKYLEDPLDTSSVVLVAGGGRISRSLSAAVKEVGHVVDAGAPTGRARGAWIDRHLKDAPIRLDPAATKLVDEHLGEDLGRLANLVEALAAAHGRGARLGPDEVAPFLGEAGSVPPWELTDALDRGDVPGALGALHRMTGAGERHPLQVMAVLHGHYARMLRLDGAAVADEKAAAALLGLRGSTFPARKALTQARRLGSSGVAEAFALLAAADLDLRGTKGWPEGLVMEVLVARLCRLAPRSRGGEPAGAGRGGSRRR